MIYDTAKLVPRSKILAQYFSDLDIAHPTSLQRIESFTESRKRSVQPYLLSSNHTYFVLVAAFTNRVDHVSDSGTSGSPVLREPV